MSSYRALLQQRGVCYVEDSMNIRRGLLAVLGLWSLLIFVYAAPSWLVGLVCIAFFLGLGSIAVFMVFA